MDLKTQSGIVYLPIVDNLEEVVSAKYIHNRLNELGIAKLKSCIHSDIALNAFKLCEVGEPFIYYDKYVYIVDGNLNVHRVRDIEYAYNNMPNRTMTQYDDADRKSRITIEKYVDSHSNKRYSKIGAISDRITLGQNITAKPFEQLLDKTTGVVNLIDLMDEAITYKKKLREAERNNEAITDTMITYSSTGSQYEITRIYTLKSEYAHMYTDETFNTQANKRVDQLISKICNNTETLSRFIRRSNKKPGDILISEAKIIPESRQIIVMLEISDRYLTEYQRYHKRALRKPKVYVGDNKIFSEYAIVQFKENAFIVKNGVLTRIDADKFRKETGYKSRNICIDANGKEIIIWECPGPGVKVSYVELIEDNLVTRAKITKNDNLKLYTGMTEKEFESEVVRAKQEKKELKLKMKREKEQKEEEARNEFRLYFDDDEEAYEQLNKLITSIYGPRFEKCADNNTEFFDIMAVTFSLASVNYTMTDQKNAFNKYKKYFDKIVLDKVTKSQTFKRSNVELNYFKADIVLTRDSRIVYKLMLKTDNIE